MASPEVRVVTVRPRTILLVLGIAVLVGLVLVLGYLAWHVLTWILIAMLLAAALNPAVEWFEQRGLSRLWAASLVFFLALLVLTAIGFLVIPPLVSQVTDFINAVPDYIDDLTAGRGPLGFLQDEYQIVDRIREAIEKQGAGGVLGLSQPVLDIVRSVVMAVAGTITIIFLTFFMLLEGPRTLGGLLDLLPEKSRPRYERVGRDIYKTISGYVTGNLLISVAAGTLATIVLFAVGSEFAIALGLLDGRAHRDELGSLPHRHRLLHCLPAVRESDSAAARLREDGAALTSGGAVRRSRRRPTRGHSRRAARDPRRGIAPRSRPRDPPVPGRGHRRFVTLRVTR
jgi:predicted PurR-regulated permease PerM